MERRRLAGELHDNIANKILGVKLRMEAIDNQRLNNRQQSVLDSIVRYVDEVYADIRLLSHNLLPATLEENGLGPALHELVARVNLIGKTTFTLTLSADTPRYAPRVEYELYCVALELVNNVLKHANATQAGVSLAQQEQTLTLAVNDNGTGKVAPLTPGNLTDGLLTESTGLGLKNIRARAESLRGQWHIGRHNGTTVSVEVPV